MPSRVSFFFIFIPLVVALLAAVGSAEAGGSLRAEIDLDGKWEMVETRDSSRKPPRDGWKETAVPKVVQGNGRGGPGYV